MNDFENFRFQNKTKSDIKNLTETIEWLIDRIAFLENELAEIKEKEIKCQLSD